MNENMITSVREKDWYKELEDLHDDDSKLYFKIVSYADDETLQEFEFFYYEMMQYPYYDAKEFNYDFFLNYDNHKEDFDFSFVSYADQWWDFLMLLVHSSIDLIEKSTDEVEIKALLNLQNQFEEMSIYVFSERYKYEVYQENILRKSGEISGNDNSDTEEFLEPTQVDKIGLLIRSGIIEFLRSKNKISDNQISGFLSVLTQKPLKQTSINPHLPADKNRPKHPFYGDRSVDRIDLILKRYGINPQSEE